MGVRLTRWSGWVEACANARSWLEGLCAAGLGGTCAAWLGGTCAAGCQGGGGGGINGWEVRRRRLRAESVGWELRRRRPAQIAGFCVFLFFCFWFLQFTNLLLDTLSNILQGGVKFKNYNQEVIKMFYRLNMKFVK